MPPHLLHGEAVGAMDLQNRRRQGRRRRAFFSKQEQKYSQRVL